MHAPLAARRCRAQRREAPARDRRGASIAPFRRSHDLVQVDAIVERRESFLGRRGRRAGTRKRGAELELGDANARRREAARTRRRILELHGAVADVVADADVTTQRGSRA